jgi:hypothetical protein
VPFVTFAELRHYRLDEETEFDELLPARQE